LHAHLAIARAAQNLAFRHRHDEHCAVRHPAQTGGPVVELEFGAHVAGQGSRFHRMGIEIAEPQPPFMPARRFAEIDAVSQNACHPSHGFPLLWPAER